jgi:uncharacterized Fe-S cluster protein YjdI
MIRMDNVTKKYTNGEVTIVWKPDLCTHARTCFVELPKVFDPWERPWVNPNGATTEEIIKIVDKCPSRALTWYHNNLDLSEKNNDSEEMVKVNIIENGPMLMEGKFKIFDHKGNEIVTKDSVALCRCGLSARKPFCDGKHRESGFKE